MIDKLKFLTLDWSRRQKIAAAITALLDLALVVCGIVSMYQYLLLILAALLVLAALYGVGLLVWKWYVYQQQEQYKQAAADFLFWFLSKNKMNEPGGYVHQESVSIPLKPLHDASEVLRTTTAALYRFVVVVEARLTLGHTPTDRDKANCDNFLEWLRTDAKNYDADHNLCGVSGFPRYYATAVEISGQHLIVRFVVIDSFAAVQYVKNPPQAQTPAISMRDDDFGGVPGDNELL